MGVIRIWKIKNGHPSTLLFITLSLGCPSRICLIIAQQKKKGHVSLKPYQEKTL